MTSRRRASAVALPIAAAALLLLTSAPSALQGAAARLDDEARRRVAAVTRIPGLVAFWDMVRRDGTGRLTAHLAPGQRHDYALDPLNYVHEYWGEGRPATAADLPMLGVGPFGDAVRIRHEADPTLRPVLQVPRARLHDTPLDVKGPGRSVSMVAWVLRESGNHAIAGIWHEGTDLAHAGQPRRVERGRRQYALFAGLAANTGASSVHVSDNGAASFGDRYARYLATTPEVLPAWRLTHDRVPAGATWAVMGFTFDNARDEVTAYLDGTATEWWIERPETHPFFQWPARGWRQAVLRRLPGMQPGEEPEFPAEQEYLPPETTPRHRVVLEEGPTTRVEVHTYAYTRVRVTLACDEAGDCSRVVDRTLLALRVNPFWFPHDLYAPASADDGGPFTIGRVIHSSRSVGFTGAIGGVAVFGRALSGEDMRRLADVARRHPLRAHP